MQLKQAQSSGQREFNFVQSFYEEKHSKRDIEKICKFLVYKSRANIKQTCHKVSMNKGISVFLNKGRGLF